MGATFASSSVPRHLARGAVGFGLLIGGIALIPVLGPAAAIASPFGFVALKGCPMCWTLGLIETISQGRLQRQCADGSCSISRGSA
jgi:hypothetical protein